MVSEVEQMSNIIERNGVSIMTQSMPRAKGLAIMVGTGGEFKPYAYVREKDIAEFRKLWKRFVGDE